MYKNINKLIKIIPNKVRKGSIFALMLSLSGSVLDIALLICVIPLGRFLQYPEREIQLFTDFFNSLYIFPSLDYGLNEFAIFMIFIAVMGSSIKLAFYRYSAFLSAKASNLILKTSFYDRLTSPNIILEKDTKSNFFSMLHKIDIISNTFFVLLSAAASLMFIIGTLSLLFYIEPVITIVTFFITSILYLIVYFFTKNPIKSAASSINLNADLRSKAILNSLSSIREAILYNKVKYFVDEVVLKDRLFRYARAIVQFYGQLPRAIFESIAIILILILCMLVRGSTGAANMDLLPILGTFLLAFQRMLPQFQTIYAAYNEFNAASDIISSFIIANNSSNPSSLTYAEESDVLKSDSTNISCFSSFKEITLKNISFKYPDAPENTLNNINLKIKRNSKIAIIGTSGAGKSTLIDLILGFHKPSSGSISIDGENLDNSNIDSYRKLFSYAPQRIGILNKSIIDNITLSNNSKKFESQARDSLMKSHMFNDNQAYNIFDEIGEGGESISGGQAQRLAIARLYFFNKDIIIFDESTSSLDIATEKKILDELTQKGVTFIHITHKIHKKYYDKVYNINEEGIKDAT